jgi:hypothetical protein
VNEIWRKKWSSYAVAHIGCCWWLTHPCYCEPLVWPATVPSFSKKCLPSDVCVVSSVRNGSTFWRTLLSLRSEAKGLIGFSLPCIWELQFYFAFPQSHICYGTRPILLPVQYVNHWNEMMSFAKESLFMRQWWEKKLQIYLPEGRAKGGRGI